MSKLEEFLAGERPEDVALFLADSYLDDDSNLRNVGSEVNGGVVLVIDGEQGRNAFEAGTGMGAMEFAKEAMGEEGEIESDLSGGSCPADTPETPADHETEFVFAFSEAQNEEVGGLYAEGDVIHAYAQCECGLAYSDRWVTGDSDD